MKGIPSPREKQKSNNAPLMWLPAVAAAIKAELK